jgi:hypothetical protein
MLQTWKHGVLFQQTQDTILKAGEVEKNLSYGT